MANGKKNQNVRQVRHADDPPAQTKEEHITEITDWDIKLDYKYYKAKLNSLREKVEGTEGEAWEERALENIAPTWWDDYNAGSFDPDLSLPEWRRAFKQNQERLKREMEFGRPVQWRGKPLEINKGGVIPRKPRKPREFAHGGAYRGKAHAYAAGGRVTDTSKPKGRKK